MSLPAGAGIGRLARDAAGLLSGAGLTPPANGLQALLSGRTPPEDVNEDELVDFILGRRLGPEIAVLDVSGGLSRGARRRLRLDRERCALLAEARTATRIRCDALLRQAGVPAILLKGEAVVALTHGDPSRRPMADLDVLVAQEHRAAVAGALTAAGFLRPGADSALHDVYLDAASRGPAMPRGVAVEVHGDLFPPPHPFGSVGRGALERGARLPGLHAPRVADAVALTGFSFVFHETDARKSWLVLRDLALLGRAAEEAGALGGLREAASDPRGSEGLALALQGALALAERVAGGSEAAVAALGGCSARTRRRRLAVRLSLREIEAGLQPGGALDRTLTRRVAAALWHAEWSATLAAFVRHAGGPGGGGPWARLRRHARAMARAGGR